MNEDVYKNLTLEECIDVLDNTRIMKPKNELELYRKWILILIKKFNDENYK